MSAESKKTLPSWILWAIILTVIVLVIVALSSGGKKTKGNTSKGTAEAETERVIVLKPGKNIALTINNKEWSPWIDATYPGIHYYAHAENGLVFKFRDGTTRKVLPEKPENFGNSSYLFMFKLKSVSESDVAVVETDTKSIVEKYINK